MPINPTFDNTIRAQAPWGLLLIAIGDGPRLSRAAAATNAKKRLTRTERPRAVEAAAALESRGPSTRSAAFRLLEPQLSPFHLFNVSTWGLVRSSNAFRSALSRRYSP